MKGRPRIYSEKLREQVRELLAKGYSVRQVAAMLQIGKSTVQRMKNEDE